jgi:hypothetical protein
MDHNMSTSELQQLRDDLRELRKFVEGIRQRVKREMAQPRRARAAAATSSASTSFAQDNQTWRTNQSRRLRSKTNGASREGGRNDRTLWRAGH